MQGIGSSSGSWHRWAQRWGARMVLTAAVMAASPAFSAERGAEGAAARPSRPTANFQGIVVSAEARQMARFAVEGRDAGGLPFAVVDKREARLLVFSGDGRLVGATPALLGLARGDTVAPGVGAMVETGIPPALRTTPSGRYESIAGPNLKGETVIWVDYDAAFAIHRLRPSAPSERRAERLASPSPDDNRISLGCVVVAGDFFDRVVLPVLGHGAGVVYVLPEPPSTPVARMTPEARRDDVGPLARATSTRRL